MGSEPPGTIQRLFCSLKCSDAGSQRHMEQAATDDAFIQLGAWENTNCPDHGPMATDAWLALFARHLEAPAPELTPPPRLADFAAESALEVVRRFGAATVHPPVPWCPLTPCRACERWALLVALDAKDDAAADAMLEDSLACGAFLDSGHGLLTVLMLASDEQAVAFLAAANTARRQRGQPPACFGVD